MDIKGCTPLLTVTGFGFPKREFGVTLGWLSP